MSNKLFGIILFNRFYVVEAESFNKLPRRLIELCPIIIDKTDVNNATVLKNRYSSEFLDPLALVPLFDTYGPTPLQQIHADVNVKFL